MTFAKELKSKRDKKALEFAKEFLQDIKPKLVESSKEGYSGFIFTIDTGKEKDILQLFTNQVFIAYLKSNLDGVDVAHEKVFHESLIRRGYGKYEHYLTFEW